MSAAPPPAPARPATTSDRSWTKGDLPVEPVPYHHLLRAPGLPWWRPVVGILMFLALAVLSILVFGSVGGILSANSGGKLTPVGYLFNNISLAFMIPAAWLTHRVIYGRRPGWLHSVVGRMRWKWLLVAMLLNLIPTAIFAYLGLKNQGLQGANQPFWLWLVAGLSVHPLQAAGEEFTFRGTLQQQFSAFIPHRIGALVISTVITALFFAAMHGTQDPWLLAYYLIFSVVTSLLTWRTGGIEAAVALHVTINVINFLFTLFTGDLSGSLNRKVGTGSPLLLSLIPLGAVMVFASDMVCKRLGLPRLFSPAGRGGTADAGRSAVGRAQA